MSNTNRSCRGCKYYKYAPNADPAIRGTGVHYCEAMPASIWMEYRLRTRYCPTGIFANHHTTDKPINN